VHEPDDEFIRLPARVEDKGDHYSVTLTDPKVRGMENLTTEQLLDLLQPGRELVLGADGVFDVVEPDGEQDHRGDVSACPVRLTETPEEVCAPHRGRPADRLGAVLRAARALARDSRSHGRDCPPRRRPREAAV
jgi:hypothetical protein